MLRNTVLISCTLLFSQRKALSENGHVCVKIKKPFILLWHRSRWSASKRFIDRYQNCRSTCPSLEKQPQASGATGSDEILANSPSIYKINDIGNFVEDFFFGLWVNATENLHCQLAGLLHLHTIFLWYTQGCSGAGTRGNGVPTPFSRFCFKMCLKLFQIGNFMGAFPHLFCEHYIPDYTHASRSDDFKCNG